MDVVVTYLNQKYVVELKLWKGEKKHQEGIQQLWDYLDRLSLNLGYLLIFELTKTKAMEKGIHRIQRKENFHCVGVTKQFFNRLAIDQKQA